MRYFVLVAFFALVALFYQVSGDDVFQASLGITNAELAERKQLMAEVEKQEIWGVMSAIQQERLRQAILLDKPTPAAWAMLTSYDKIVDPAYSSFLNRLVHWVPATIRDKFINALPEIPHEETAQLSSNKPWLTFFDQSTRKELLRRILLEKDVPQGFPSWKEATSDADIDDWIDEYVTEFIQNKGAETSPETLQRILGITNEELTNRMDLLNKISKLEIYEVMSTVQRERLSQAVLLNKPRPKVWNILTTYDKIVLPESADFLHRLVHVHTPIFRNTFINALPRIPHEDVFEKATKQPWWNTLSVEERNRLTVSILHEDNVPEGYESWKAAIDDAKFGEWIKENKAKILA